jgi:hypothetical protein
MQVEQRLAGVTAGGVGPVEADYLKGNKSSKVAETFNYGMMQSENLPP